jgi:hypothetical protein
LPVEASQEPPLTHGHLLAHFGPQLPSGQPKVSHRVPENPGVQEHTLGSKQTPCSQGSSQTGSQSFWSETRYPGQHFRRLTIRETFSCLTDSTSFCLNTGHLEKGDERSLIDFAIVVVVVVVVIVIVVVVVVVVVIVTGIVFS